MLYTLHVKDLALISEQEIEFGEGLNILTGETGAGKSVIIGSVNLALGGRADKDMIRKGADYALIELTFFVDDPVTLAKIKEMDLPVSEDGTVLLSRKILPGRNICKVGGESVTLAQLRSLGELLINIHGQNEHQALLSRTKQLEILDKYCGESLGSLKKELGDVWSGYEMLKKRYEATDMDEAARKREADLASYELEEIIGADLREGEDEELENRYRKMSGSMKITEALDGAEQSLFADNAGAADLISEALSDLSSVSGIDDDAKGLYDQLMELDSLLSDFRRSMSDYLSDMEFDDREYEEVEERLNLINRLKDKYGRSIEDILSYADEKQKELDILSNLEEERAAIKDEMDSAYAKALELCMKISAIRKNCAKELADKLIKALTDLNFLDVRFEIQIRPDEKRIGNGGYDEAEYMISTNPGEALRPLGDIASGGELSRVMLALKTVMADHDDIASVIFDEIDTGISGITAWKVSEKLGQLAGSHQIICITHLAQIAAMYDDHFLIEKGLDGGRTISRIRKLTQEESITELGRMLGSGDMTEAVRDNAVEMRNKAVKVKERKA